MKIIAIITFSELVNLYHQTNVISKWVIEFLYQCYPDMKVNYRNRLVSTIFCAVLGAMWLCFNFIYWWFSCWTHYLCMTSFYEVSNLFVDEFDSLNLMLSITTPTQHLHFRSNQNGKRTTQSELKYKDSVWLWTTEPIYLFYSNEPNHTRPPTVSAGTAKVTSWVPSIFLLYIRTNPHLISPLQSPSDAQNWIEFHYVGVSSQKQRENFGRHTSKVVSK